MKTTSDESPTQKTEISLKLIDHVRQGQMAYFQYYKNYEFYYKTDTGLLFKIHASEVNDVTLMGTEKASTLMRWIRQQLVEIEQATTTQTK